MVTQTKGGIIFFRVAGGILFPPVAMGGCCLSGDIQKGRLVLPMAEGGDNFFLRPIRTDLELSHIRQCPLGH